MKDKPLPSDTIIQNVARFPDSYPFSEENAAVVKCLPRMAFNQSLPNEAMISPFWQTQTARRFRPMLPCMMDVDHRVSGLLSQSPGCLWHYMTCHLTKIQAVINRGYFDDIQYVKVPALWSKVMNASQLQPGLASVSEEVSRDGWAVCTDQAIIPPELLKPFDMSLLEPTEKIPAGNASFVAVTNYAVRTLQMMLCESSMFQHQLMWDPKYHSCCLVFAFLPASRIHRQLSSTSLGR